MHESLREAVVRLIEDALRAGDAVVAGEIVAQHVLTPAEEVVEQVRNWSKE
jgi:hypothetical protein